MKNLAFWMSTPYFAHFEIARDMGFAAVVLDVEHGTFGLDDLDRLIPFCHGIGLKVYAKVLGPQVEAVQQALDFGADGVIIPHIGGIEHATKVCAAAKFPPVGLRSSAGWRPTGYKRSDDAYFAEQNRRVKCWPPAASDTKYMPERTGCPERSVPSQDRVCSPAVRRPPAFPRTGPFRGRARS